MRIALLCNTSVGGSGILATELALGLGQLGHHVHIIGESRPLRLNDQERCTESQEMFIKDLGEIPPVKSFWGQLAQLARKSLLARFNNNETRSTGSVSFHELLGYSYPLFETSAYPTLRAANTIAAMMDKYKIEMINAHYAIPHATSALLARESGLNVRVVTTLHGTDITRVGADPAFRYTTKHALVNSDLVTAVCDFLAKEAQEKFSLKKDIKVIPNWVDPQRFQRSHDFKQRAKYAQPEECLFLHASNFRPIKCSLNVIKIFSKITESIPARLILVGDGPDKAACLTLADELGVSGRILSIPSVAAIENLMNISDILLLPSEMEALPLVMLEAMASETVVIASDVGGIKEVITNWETGIVFAPGDLSLMAKAAIEVAKDKTLGDKLRSNARAYVLENYTPEKRILEYQSAYESLINR